MTKHKSRPSEDGVVADTGNSFNTPPRLTKAQKEANANRADRGSGIISEYGYDNGADESNLTDILADLMHRSHLNCEAENFEAENFEDALRRARMHFQAESEGSN